MTVVVDPRAICESVDVGEGTRIAAFSHVLEGASIGGGCSIAEHVFVGSEAVVGSRVTIQCGVQLWNGVTLEDDVVVGPNATFTVDKESEHASDPTASTVVRRGARIGANATILAGVTIASRAVVTAGAVVLRSVPPNAIVAGNPATIVGYVDTTKPTAIARGRPDSSTEPSSVAGVTVHRLPFIRDMRGNLTVGEFERSVPFAPKRYFIVFDVAGAEVRGEHAHRTCHQFLVCPNGSVSVVADDGENREEFVLDSPSTGLYLPPMTWGIQYRHSQGALLLVFASHFYDSEDYIRDYEEFLAAKRRAP